jgi:uncharacterized membrane protein YkoI
MHMRKRLTILVAGMAVAGVGAGVAMANGNGPAAGGSRLDDGKDLLPQAGITEAQAIAAAQGAGSGDLNEVDLEHYKGSLVFNVDVGNRDVKVDAASGDVLASPNDDESGKDAASDD